MRNLPGPLHPCLRFSPNYQFAMDVHSPIELFNAQMKQLGLGNYHSWLGVHPNGQSILYAPMNLALSRL